MLLSYFDFFPPHIAVFLSVAVNSAQDCLVDFHYPEEKHRQSDQNILFKVCILALMFLSVL